MVEKELNKNWVYESFPGIYVLGGNESTDQALLIKKEDKAYIFFTGCSAEESSYIGDAIEIMPEGVQDILDWGNWQPNIQEDSMHRFYDWLREGEDKKYIIE